MALKWLAWLFIVIAPLTTEAATRLVATTGNNSGNCTSSPCQTLQYAFNQAVGGDTISVSSGTYAGFSSFGHGGTSDSNRITIKPANGAIVTLDRAVTPVHYPGYFYVMYFAEAGSSWITFDGNNGSQDEALIFTDSDWGSPFTGEVWTPGGGTNQAECDARVDDPRYRRGAMFLTWDSGPSIENHPRGITIKNSRLYNFYGVAVIGGETRDFVFENNHMYNDMDRDVWHNQIYGTYLAQGGNFTFRNNRIHGLYVGLRFGTNSGDGVSGGVIENNFIYDNWGKGVFAGSIDGQYFCMASAGGSGVLLVRTGNFTVKNNVVYGNRLPGTAGWGETCCSAWTVVGLQVGGNLAYHNTVYGHGPSYSGGYSNPDGISAGGGGVVRNNVSYNNVDDFEFNGADNDHNWDTGSGNPQFVDPGAGDFRPNPGSPLIGAGTPISSVPTDILGVTRSTTAPTIGAYEGSGEGPPPNTYAVTRNLSTVTGGQTITASWVTDPGPANAADWICLTLASQTCQQYISQDGAGNTAWIYIGGTTSQTTAPLTGNFSLAAPLLSGSYKFWYCINNSLTNCPAQSEPFTVEAPVGGEGYVLVKAAWHKADVAPSANWIEGVGGNAKVRPGGKLRYVGAIACKDCTASADHYGLQCQIGIGGPLTRLTDSCASYPLCFDTDTQVAMGDNTTPLLPLDPGMTGIAGKVVAKAVNTAVTVTPANNQQFDMVYVVRFDRTIGLENVQCRPIHNNGTVLDNYLAQPSAQVFTGEFRLLGPMTTGRIR